jgi:DNA polymerase III gamma/tau subunit
VSGKDKKITEEEVRSLLGLPDIKMVDSLLSSLTTNEPQKALDLIEEIEENGVNFQQFVSYTLEVLREALVAKIKEVELDYGFFKETSQRDILKLVKAFLDAERSLKGSGSQSLVLEMLIPEFCVQRGDEEDEEDEEEEDTTEEYDDIQKSTDTDSNYIDIEDIRKNWDKVAEAVKPIHRHLYGFLETSKPTKFEKGKLHIEVPFQFYKDQIDRPASKDAIVTVLKETFNMAFSIVCTVNEKTKPRMKSNVDVVLKKTTKPKKEDHKKKEYESQSISTDIEAIFEGM